MSKTIVITGASQGIGAGLVNTFAGRGYNVVATSRSVSRSSEIPASDKVIRVDGDIADPATARKVVETALSRFGRIDALVNNAGIFFAKPFVDYTLDDYRRLAATNVEGFLHLTQLVVRQMVEQKNGGSIVSITTPLISHPIAGMPVSVAMITKGGIEAASKNIAMEYARDGIRDRCICSPVNRHGSPGCRHRFGYGKADPRQRHDEPARVADQVHPGQGDSMAKQHDQ